MAKNIKIKEDSKRFIRLRDTTLDNEAFRIKNRTAPFIILSRLIQFVVRRPYNGDLGLYENYYKKGLLASSITTRKLAKDFGYGNNTNQIRRVLLDMENCGWLKKESVAISNNKEQTVFVLGAHGNTEPGVYENNYWYYEDNL